MAWKYRNNPEEIRALRESQSYVPFAYRDETRVSPFYHFKDIEDLPDSKKKIAFEHKEQIGKDESLEEQYSAVLQDPGQMINILDKIKEDGEVPGQITKQKQPAGNQNNYSQNKMNASGNRKTIGSGGVGGIGSVLPNLLKIEGVQAKKRENENLKGQKNRNSDDFLSGDSSQQDYKNTSVNFEKNIIWAQNEYLSNSIISKADANQKRGLRKIFILHCKSRTGSFSLNIEEFFIPVYAHIGDQSLLLQDFALWKEYLAKWMKLRPDKQVNHVFTISGVKLKNLHMVQKNENILIIQDEDGQLMFWYEFQLSHNISLGNHAQKNLISTLNSLSHKDDIYKIFLSPSHLAKILAAYPNQTALNSSNSYYKNSINKTKILPEIHSNYASKGISDNLDESNILNASLTAPFGSKDAFGLSKKPMYASNNNLLNNKSPNSNRHSPKNSQTTAGFLGEKANKAVGIDASQKERLQLVDLYSQYQQIMLNSIGKKIINPNLQPSFSQGALIRQFNGVKMKILQQSFPFLASKRSDNLLTSPNNLTKNKISNSPGASPNHFRPVPQQGAKQQQIATLFPS